MSNFTKTLIVDATDHNADYDNIKEAAWQFDPINPYPIADGGTIIVEQGTYTLDQEDDYSTTNTNTRTTIHVPSNVTIIGRGNVVINVTANISALKNADQTNGNDRIRIEGFKIEVNQSFVALTRPVGHPLPQAGEGGISNLYN